MLVIEKLDKISDELSAIAGGLTGIADGSREQFTKEELYNYSNKIINIIDEIHKIVLFYG